MLGAGIGDLTVSISARLERVLCLADWRHYAKMIMSRFGLDIIYII